MMSRPESIALGSSSVVKGTRISPSAMLWPLIAAVLAFMVLLPLAWLVWISFQSDTTDQLTLGNYIDAFQSRTSLIAILNSLLLALGVATGATIAGTIMAWLITRTDMPFRGLVRALILASFVTPSFMGAIAWILLASPNAGWLNQMWVAVSGSDTPLFNIFSLGGAMFVMAIYAISYPFSLVAATLDQAPSEYENAARTLGAGLSRITWSITLPLAAPAIISGFILSFLEAIASFGVAAFILIPARRPVITIELLSLFSEFPPRLGQAAAYGIPLLAVTAVLLTIQRRLLARRSFTLITGKGGSFRRVALGVWRWPAFALAMVPPILSVLLPYAAMLLVSLSVAWGKGPFAPGNLSFQWYHKVFFDTVSARNSLGHSLVYCSVAATIAVTIATLIAYTRARRIIPGSALLGFLAMAPFIVPGIVLAIGFYAAYAHPPIKLVGTPWIIIMAFATQFLPIAYANGMSMFGTLSVDLENAGRILGASRIAVLRVITAPLLRGALLSSWMLVFISSFRELSTVIFLFVGGTAVITTQIYDFSSSGYYESVCVLGIVMMLVVFSATLAVYGLFGAPLNRLQSSEVPN
jgi:iron(III) transport system permease protein